MSWGKWGREREKKRKKERETKEMREKNREKKFSSHELFRMWITSWFYVDHDGENKMMVMRWDEMMMVSIIL